ncbi:MAG: hypothetical protein MPW16_14680 [Candidatus Manganitrophus sp.]|nr:MAG: hypothetical protein MPW16_14680 [Candidatus Manganitrophus sp.]
MSGHSGAQVEVTAPARLRRMGEWGVEGGGKVSKRDVLTQWLDCFVAKMGRTSRKV